MSYLAFYRKQQQNASTAWTIAAVFGDSEDIQKTVKAKQRHRPHMDDFWGTRGLLEFRRFSISLKSALLQIKLLNFEWQWSAEAYGVCQIRYTHLQQSAKPP